MKKSYIVLLFILVPLMMVAQKIENSQIKLMVAQFKTDPKGPYKDIRWYCPDGTTRPPQERCPEPGVQRARYKDAVVSLGNSNHIYLGQILTRKKFCSMRLSSDNNQLKNSTPQFSSSSAWKAPR